MSCRCLSHQRVTDGIQIHTLSDSTDYVSADLPSYKIGCWRDTHINTRCDSPQSCAQLDQTRAQTEWFISRWQSMVYLRHQDPLCFYHLEQAQVARPWSLATSKHTQHQAHNAIKTTRFLSSFLLTRFPSILLRIPSVKGYIQTTFRPKSTFCGRSIWFVHGFVFATGVIQGWLLL